jgi:hypothetical protein
MSNILKLRTNVLICAQLLALLLFSGVLSAQDSIDSSEADYDDYDGVTIQSEADTIVNVPKPDESYTDAWRQQARTVPDSVIDGYKKDPDFAYANDPSFWKKEPPPDNSGLVRFIDWVSRSSLIRWLLYLFLSAIILFTLYQVMVVNNFFVFSRKKKKNTEEPEHADDVSQERLDQLLRNAINERNYRLATRLLYLKTLKLLAERQMIQLHAKNTNYDYVQQMRSKDGDNDFQRLTRIYEYAWYGEYSLNDEQFEYVKQHFNKFNSR